jgi:hypothetical protein
MAVLVLLAKDDAGARWSGHAANRDDRTAKRTVIV